MYYLFEIKLVDERLFWDDGFKHECEWNIYYNLIGLFESLEEVFAIVTGKNFVCATRKEINNKYLPGIRFRDSKYAGVNDENGKFHHLERVLSVDYLIEEAVFEKQTDEVVKKRKLCV